MKRTVFLALFATLLTATLAFAAPMGPPRAQVIAFSNSAPHISVIDGQTHQVIKTANIPQPLVWGWNDDNNYYDGTNLWLSVANPNTNAAEVVLLNLETLQFERRIPIGQEPGGIFSGRPSRTGRVFFAKFRTGELVAIDTKTHSVVQTVKLPIDGGVACDVEVATGFDRRERAYVPTMAGNTVLVVDPSTLRVLDTLRYDTRPWMATATPDGRRLWVQEQTGNANLILNSTNLQMVDRVPTAPAPDTGTFSPDGKLHFTGHFTNGFVIANETDTFREVWRTQSGANSRILGVHPAGTFVYAIMSNEGGVAVLEAATGRIVTRVALGTNPAGLFVRRLN
jgi:DNA-binding beta-propeller fold protein YncE